MKKKIYTTPSVEVMSMAAEQLLTASGLETEELQETEEVDEAWSRMSTFVILTSD